MNKINRVVVIMLLITVISGIKNSAEAKNIRRFAVIVGSNNGGPDRVMLRYAASDADTMMNVLNSIGGVSGNDSLLLLDPDRKSFISALSKIKNEIAGSKQKDKRIEFVFYFSGHSDEEALLLGREKVYYKELKDCIRGIPADVRIAILDSCSSGAFTRIKGGTFRYPFVLDSSFNMVGDAFMTSSSSNEASQESDSIKGSFFTYYLVSGLRGAADMIPDGRITLNEAYQYAYNETLERTEKTLGGAQHPNYDIQMNGTGDVVITDIKIKTSRLILDKKITGKVYIRNSDNVFIAELQKPYGKEMEIAIPAGEYSLLNQIDKSAFEINVKVSPEKSYRIALNDMKQSAGEETVLRGKQKPEKTHRKVQVTFGYPLGSNGFNSLEYSNDFSINLLYGINGGVNIFEMGSILNYNEGEIKGFQLSGISNINRENSKGFLLSGVSNICMDSASGLFVSGVVNYSEKKSEGFFLSGVSNVCMDSTSGLFISGVLNYSDQNSKGFQLSTINITSSDVKGFQLGVFNYAQKINGVQFGVINYLNDGEEGLPIGIISIVKNGHFEFEPTAGEVIYSNFNYKMGIEKFYTIFKTGYSSYKNNSVYSLGIGFGGNIPLSEKQKLSLDLSSNNIYYNNKWDGDLNLLNKVDLNYKYQFTEKLSFLIGPSFNIYITKEKVDGRYGTLDIPYTIHTNEWTDGKLYTWIGFNAGLSLSL